jgi:hypothetical protein
MKNTIFKLGMYIVLVAGGFLAVYAFVFSGFFTRSEAAGENRSQNSRVSGTRNVRATNSDIPNADVPEAEYKVRLARIRQLSDDGNFDKLVKEGDEIQAIWAENGGERFAKLILEMLDAFGYSRISDGHPEVRSLSDEYSTTALARADSFSLESECRLLMRLRSFSDLPSLDDAEVLKLRNSSKLWLHLFTRLANERDPSADPYLALQKQLSAPENPNWNDEGSNPVAKAKFEQAMKVYYEKRKWLGEQYKLRNLATDLAEPWGTKFLANVYSRPPFAREELKMLLSENPLSDKLKKGILKARDDLASKTQ